MIAEDVASFESEISAEEKIRIRKEVKTLSVLKPWKAYSYILLDWIIIISTIFISVKVSNPLVSILAIFVIGSRQHALLLIMHDAAHTRLTNHKKINLVISDLLCAFPAFVTTTKYKDTHLAHHRYLNTELDPDLQLRKGKKEWLFPQKKQEVIFLLLRQLLGLNTAQLLGKIYRFGVTNATANKPTKNITVL